MEIYLVGGAVRDQLLHLPVLEKDWVVVGATPEIMRAKGYRAVGKDFPVFLHPETHDEYALARTEKKTAPGYKGFRVHAAPDVTLHEDLHRRDLTINAMALAADGQLIDPYGGQRDIEARLLRHISSAFCEDPVRLLRVARFAARYAHLGFHIALETQTLMAQMVRNGEVDALVPERVWSETFKALSENTPVAYFQTLRECGALQRIFPELDRLFGVPQPAKYHPEIDTGVHCLLTLEQAARLSYKPTVRFAALVHDLGKGVTPPETWPSHHGHETAGLPLLNEFCRRLRVPNVFFKLAAQVMRYHTHCHRAMQLQPATVADMFNALGAFKANADLTEFLLSCEADAKGRRGLETAPYPQSEYLLAAQKACRDLDISQVLTQNLSGPEIGRAIRQLRIDAIRQCKIDFIGQAPITD